MKKIILNKKIEKKIGYIPVRKDVLICLILFILSVLIYFIFGGSLTGFSVVDIENVSKIDMFCEPDWNCTDWSECSYEGIKIRTCVDENNCSNFENGQEIDKPAEVMSCTYQGVGKISYNIISKEPQEERPISYYPVTLYDVVEDNMDEWGFDALDKLFFVSGTVSSFFNDKLYVVGLVDDSITNLVENNYIPMVKGVFGFYFKVYRSMIRSGHSLYIGLSSSVIRANNIARNLVLSSFDSVFYLMNFYIDVMKSSFDQLWLFVLEQFVMIMLLALFFAVISMVVYYEKNFEGSKFHKSIVKHKDNISKSIEKKKENFSLPKIKVFGKGRIKTKDQDEKLKNKRSSLINKIKDKRLEWKKKKERLDKIRQRNILLKQHKKLEKQKDNDEIKRKEKDKQTALYHLKMKKRYTEQLVGFLDNTLNMGISKDKALKMLYSKGWPKSKIRDFVDKYYNLNKDKFDKAKQMQESQKRIDRLQAQIDDIDKDINETPLRFRAVKRIRRDESLKKDDGINGISSDKKADQKDQNNSKKFDIKKSYDYDMKALAKEDRALSKEIYNIEKEIKDINSKLDNI